MEIAYYLSREMGGTMAEIARNVGVGTSAVAMALKQKEAEESQKLDSFLIITPT